MAQRRPTVSAFFFDTRLSQMNAGLLRTASGGSGADRLPGGPPFKLGQPVVLLQPATAQAGSGGQVGARLPGHAWLVPDLWGLLAHNTSRNDNPVIRGYRLVPADWRMRGRLPS